MTRFLAPCIMLLLAACAQSNPPPIMSSKGAVELRAMQTRSFETADRPQTLRNVISTLQDLGYSVDKIEARAGTVTATKLAALTMTATVLPGQSAPTQVRANAMVLLARQQHQVDDQRFYLDDFFKPLAQTMALDARDATLALANENSLPASAQAPATAPWSATPAP